MTTIACDGKTVASDSRGMRGDVICPHNERKTLRGKDVIYGLTGVSLMLAPMRTWYEAGADPKHRPKCSFAWTFAVFRAKHCEVFCNHSLQVEINKYPIAIGSGMNPAMHALMLGLTPKQAVKFACRVDPYSGGSIRCLELASTRPPAGRRASPATRPRGK